MKISVNDIELFTLNETQKGVIKNDIHGDEFDADMKLRLRYILMHKYEQCFDRLKKEWDIKLSESTRKIDQAPTDRDAYAKLVFSQPDYKDRKSREAEKV